MTPKNDPIPDHVITSMLESLKGDMEKGFERVERKFEEVVHKGEYQSTIQRIDTEIGHVKSVLESELTHVQKDVEEGFREIETRDVARDQRNARRMTWAITLAGVLSGVVFGSLTLIF